MLRCIREAVHTRLFSLLRTGSSSSGASHETIQKKCSTRQAMPLENA